MGQHGIFIEFLILKTKRIQHKKRDGQTLKSLRKSVVLPLAASIGALFTVYANASIFIWNNSGIDWGTGTDWSPLGPPTATDVALFDPYGSAFASPVVNPNLGAGQAVLSLTFDPNQNLGGWAVTGANPLTIGGTGSTGLTTYGPASYLFNGPTIVGAGAAATVALNVNFGSTLTFAGTTAITANQGNINVTGGTLVLDNTATANSARLLATGTVTVNGSGAFILNGNSSAAVSQSVGSLNVNANTLGGVDLIEVAPNGQATTLTFANSAAGFNSRPGTRAVYSYVTTSGNFGDVNGGKITFVGSPFLGSSGLLSTAAAGANVGFAIANDSGGTDFATWNSTSGIVRAGATTTTSTDLNTGVTSASRVQFNPAAGATITPTGTVTTGSLRITPAGAGSTLAMGTNGLTTTALMLDGANSFTITGTGTYGSSGTRYIYVNNAGATLFTSQIIDSGANPTVFAGPGFVELTGATLQNTNTDNSRFSIAGGVVRANSTEVNFAGTNGVISLTGGVLEIKNGANGTGTSADFTRPVGTLAGSVFWGAGNAAEIGSGGFSAFGSNASVNLGGAVTPVSLQWNQTSFIGDGYALKFGSTQSNAVLTWYNPLQLDNGATYQAREINVTAGTGGDKTVIAGVISGAANADLLKTGTGVLELNQANTYSGSTLVQNGTLLATNTTGSATGTGGTVVGNGAKLAGNGTLGAITLELGGKLAPGVLLDTTPTTLSASGLVWNAGSTLVFDLSTANNTSDLLALSGALTRGVSGVYAFDFDAGGKAGLTYNLITFSSTTFASPTLFTATDLAPGVTGTFQFGGTGNNTLQFATAVATPEPSTALSILCGITMLGVFGRFRRSLC